MLKIRRKVKEFTQKNIWKDGLETRERSWAWRREEEKESYRPQGCLMLGFSVSASSGLRARHSLKHVPALGQAFLNHAAVFGHKGTAILVVS